MVVKTLLVAVHISVVDVSGKLVVSIVLVGGIDVIPDVVNGLDDSVVVGFMAATGKHCITCSWNELAPKAA